MKRLKKVLLLVLMICGITVNVSALSKKDFSVSIAPEVGFMFGTAKEYVDFMYQGNMYGLSELDYDFHFPYIGAEIESKLFKWVYLGGSVAFGIPMECGIMQDYDWQNRVYSFNHEYKNALTNYSLSRSELDWYFEGKLNLGLNVDLPLRINLKPYVSLQYVDVRFDLQECYLRYSNVMYNFGGGNYYYYPLDVSSYTNYIGGNVGNYNLYYSDFNGDGLPAFAFGLKFDIQTIPFLDLKGNIGILPCFTVADIDYHKLRSLYFKGVASPVFAYYADLSLSLKLGRFVAVGLKGSLYGMPKVNGVEMVKRAGESRYTATSGFEGMEMVSGKIALLVSVTF